MTEAYLVGLDGARIRSREAFFRELSKATDVEIVPSLDALDDDLTNEIPLRCGPFKIIWKNAHKSNWDGSSGLTEIVGVLTLTQQRHSDLFRTLEFVFLPDTRADTWTFPAMYNSEFYRRQRHTRGVYD